MTHPRFFGYVPIPSNPAAVLGELLATGINVFAGSWQSGAACAVIERQVIGWLARELGLPESAGGLAVSGGSQANLTALAVALHRQAGGDRGGAVAYYSDQTHSSVERALRVLGLPAEGMRKLASGAGGCLPLAPLEQAVAADRASGLRPFCVIANAGTTSSGAVDPLPAIAAFCRREGLWFHADAAYGGAAVLCAQGRRALAGLELADSLALDPHKWLFQPMDLGCVLVREDRWLVEAFRIVPDYLRDVYRVEPELNYCDRGIELTRPLRVLKLWFTLHTFGVDALRRAVAWGFELAEEAERLLRCSGEWEILTPASLAIVTFRRARLNEDAQLALIDALRESGFALLTSTRVGGRNALRLCTINPRTTFDDLRRTVARLETAARPMVE